LTRTSWIYAHDLNAGAKHQQAAELIRRLWENGGGVLSTQVLQEFYVNVTQKIPQPIPLATARGIIDAYRAWQRAHKAPGWSNRSLMVKPVGWIIG
jgi:predicted nucleic acid-binding protein